MCAIFTITVLLAVTSFKVFTALEFNCTFEMRWFDFVNNVYECNAKVLFDETNIDKVTSVFGSHQTELGNADVIALRINYQNLEYFPVNIEDYFPNLKVLTLYGNSISEVKNSHLAPFPDLVYLNLYTNKISTLDGDLFLGLKSMKYVSFERNNIVHVGHDLTLPRDGLVFFDANPCINMRAATRDEIEALRFNLLINCTLISPVETALENRPNLLTNLNEQVQSLEQRIKFLEDFIEGNCRCK